MIAIVDYGAGNLNSVKKAFDYLGAEVSVTDEPGDRRGRGQDRIPWCRALFFICRFWTVRAYAKPCCKALPPASRFSESAWGCNGFSRAVKSLPKSPEREFSPANAGSFRLP